MALHRISTSLVGRYMCFTLRRDASCRIRLSTFQKCTTAIRQLAYVRLADMFDEYLHMDTARYAREGARFSRDDGQHRLQALGVEELPGGLERAVHYWIQKQTPLDDSGRLNNNINVLQSSHLFNDECRDEGPEVRFVANGTPKESYFMQRQESARKDVERAFGGLQARWGII
ncbi:uncharacterized protein LOC125220319 [Salvia hispanica]|uniref:uncharacterized protein LOC125220319 n=1 Tax=Salvia hispanica TaxID=49212 RepID=UPI0020093369|nr:uncharacterized protein LOC125220319 [Salvia hispanica]